MADSDSIKLCECGCGRPTSIAVKTTSRNIAGQPCRYISGHTSRRVAHGMSYKKTYRAWIGMRARCSNERDTGWPLYGGRGIRVCDRWLKSFQNFLADMGEAPAGRTLDRVNPNGNYEQSNCRWSTPTEQNRNRRVTLRVDYLGESLTLAEWAERLSLKNGTLHSRYYERKLRPPELFGPPRYGRTR